MGWVNSANQTSFREPDFRAERQVLLIRGDATMIGSGFHTQRSQPGILASLAPCLLKRIFPRYKGIFRSRPLISAYVAACLATALTEPRGRIVISRFSRTERLCRRLLGLANGPMRGAGGGNMSRGYSGLVRRLAGVCGAGKGPLEVLTLYSWSLTRDAWPVLDF